MVEDAFHMMKILGLERPVLLGHSLGGSTTMFLALLYVSSYFQFILSLLLSAEKIRLILISQLYNLLYFNAFLITQLYAINNNGNYHYMYIITITSNIFLKI